jgi:hypothetical protein
MDSPSSKNRGPKYMRGEEDLFEEGLLNALRASPEMWILTIIIAACVIRWVYLYFNMVQNWREADFYTDENGVN